MRVLVAVTALALVLSGCGRDGGRDASGCVHLAVPAYVGPSQVVRAAADGSTGIIVLNPANGPDIERDDHLAPAVTAVREAGVAVLGYVETGYGTATADDVVEQAKRYERWYGVDGMFLDEVSSDAAGLGRYREIVDALRAAGFDIVAINPGVYPDRTYLDLADIVVTFEGTAAEYRTLERPAGFDAVDREWHLVHTATEQEAIASVGLAADRGVTRVFVTDRPEEGDTWNALPPYFDDEVRWARRARCQPSS